MDPLLPPATDMSFWNLILKADLVVQSILLLLFLASVFSWSIMIERVFFLTKINFQLKQFVKTFWRARSLESFYTQVKDKAPHPANDLFVGLVDERDRLKKEPLPLDYMHYRIQNVMGSFTTTIAEELENNLSFLATTGSVAPFVGLLGTVWGIMHSFTSIASSKNTSLAVVAPGIAEALFVTAVGLAVAIPAVIGYNKINKMIQNYLNQLDYFSGEVENIIVKNLMIKGDITERK